MPYATKLRPKRGPRPKKPAPPFLTVRRKRIFVISLWVTLLGVSLLFLSKARFPRWTAGTELVHVTALIPYGVVVDYERDHLFPTGKRARAYLIRKAGEGGELWYSHEEIHSLVDGGHLESSGGRTK